MSEFKIKGYLVVRGLIDKIEAENMHRYMLDRENLGNAHDGQVPGSPSFYEDPRGVLLQNQLRPHIERHTEIPLKTVYCYHRVYRKGAILRTHKDSVRNEISVTLNLGQEGEPWDLWIMDYHENPQKVTLLPGDALIYRGAELAHWRGQLEHADHVTQIMFGFIDKKGKHKIVPALELIRKIQKKWRTLWGVAY